MYLSRGLVYHVEDADFIYNDLNGYKFHLILLLNVSL